MQIKGLEMPGYDPRRHQNLGLGLAVSARGACHNRAGLGMDTEPAPWERQEPETVASAVEQTLAREDRQALLDALGVCKFFRAAFDNLELECAEIVRTWSTARAALIGRWLASDPARPPPAASSTSAKASLPSATRCPPGFAGPLIGESAGLAPEALLTHLLRQARMGWRRPGPGVNPARSGNGRLRRAALVPKKSHMAEEPALQMLSRLAVMAVPDSPS